MKNRIIAKIIKSGPLRLDRFFKAWTKHYYANCNPFGAPEISQLFGESIALWLIAATEQLASFNLVEIGAGRGILLNDILRLITQDKTTSSKLQASIIVENSPSLIKEQKKTLQNHQVCWVKNCELLPSGNNMIIANEFFDAIEPRQFTNKDGVILETYVNYADNKFEFSYIPIKSPLAINGIYETSPAARKLCTTINKKLGNGQALIIDYGYFENPGISTLQCLANNKITPLFDKPFVADITYLVNFLELANCFIGRQVNLMTQKEFLIANKVDLLALKLIKSGADPENIIRDMTRLVSPEQMGELFKVMVVS